MDEFKKSLEAAGRLCESLRDEGAEDEVLASALFLYARFCLSVKAYARAEEIIDQAASLPSIDRHFVLALKGVLAETNRGREAALPCFVSALESARDVLAPKYAAQFENDCIPAWVLAELAAMGGFHGS